MITSRRSCFILFALAAPLLTAVAVRAQNLTATVSVGTNPNAIAVNPATNRIFVANTGSNTVSVINGATHSVIATVTVGSYPVALAVNPETNKIYVANNNNKFGSAGTVTVIDGANNYATTSIASTGYPEAVAVNSATNKIYVGTVGITGTSVDNVTVIDGATNSVAATVTEVSGPYALAVNPVTNKTYVGNYTLLSGNTQGAVTVIDGANSYAASTVLLGNTTYTMVDAIAVNPVTNQIYAVGGLIGTAGGRLYGIDGASATLTSSLLTNSGPATVVVNPVTNKVFVSDEDGSLASVSGLGDFNIFYVSVFNGATSTTPATSAATVEVGSTDNNGNLTGIVPYAMAVNPETNKVYVANWNGGSSLVVIDGTSYAASTITAGGNGTGTAITVNPLTNTIYAANYGGNVTVIDGTVTTTANLPAGSFPLNMALNPATNKVYIINYGDNDGSTPGTVTVVNGTTGAVVTTLTVGLGPWSIAANPVTNRIYVANSGDYDGQYGSVSVIDGSTDTVAATVQVGVNPDFVAVNPVTNKVFVINNGSSSPTNVPGSVSIIDGATNTVTATLPTRPYWIAVNTATNRVYFSNYHSVTVADGTTGAALASIATTSAGLIAVNTVSDKIYVLNNQDNNGDGNTCTVIDGAANAVLAVLGTALDPAGIAINPVTNMVYVVDQGGPPFGYVTIINGATNTLAPINLGGYLDGDILVPADPTSIAVNPVTNKIYVGDFGTGGFAADSTATGSTVTVIDANNGNSTTNITTGVGPEAVLVNPVTDQIYVLNEGTTIAGGGSLTVIGDYQAVPLSTSITPLPGNQSAGSTPTFTFSAQSLFSPVAPPPLNVFFQIDSITGPWTAATPAGGSFSGTTAALSPGLHVLYAYAGDGQDGTSPQLDSVLTGAVSVYYFVVTSTATHLAVVAPASATSATPFNVSVVALDSFNNPAIGYTGTAALTSSDSAASFQPIASNLASVAGTFSAKLYGAQGVFETLGETITATDTVTSSITGTSAGIEVFKTFVTVNVVVPSPTYDGSPHGVTVTTTPPGVALNVTYQNFASGSPVTSTPPTAAGDYQVVVSSNDSVYYFNPVTRFLYIAQATPVIIWPAPAAINFGAALSSTQLDATANIPGGFVYNPPAGSVLGYGVQGLSATFTPNDAVDYADAFPSVNLTVNPPPPSVPIITLPPASQVGIPGGSVNFSVTATGYPVPAVQWYFNNSLIPGATNPTLTIPVAGAGAAGTYTVTVTNSQGTKSSSAALAIVVGELSGDPSLSKPEYLATDGIDLLVAGKNSNASDPNRDGASGRSIFSVPLPLGTAPATSLYPAYDPNQLAETGGSIFWIDPNSGPQSSTQILSAADGDPGTVNPIYTGTSVNEPILAGSGLATDGTLLYAADQVNGSVWSLNTDGSGLTQIGPNRYAGGSPPESLNTIAVYQGALYIADSGANGGTPAVLSIATSGSSFTTIASGAPLVSPSGIAVGDGMIYVADPGAGNTIWQIPIGGGTPVALASGSLNGTTIGSLTGLLYSKGKLYVADTSAGSIYELQVATQAAPRFSSPLTASGVLQYYFTYQVQASGGLSPYTYAASGLPNGLGIGPNSGLISGFPQQSGTFPVSVTITDSTNPTAQTVHATLQLTIYALAINSSLYVNGIENSSIYYQVQASGGSGNYSYSATGLPAWASLDPVEGVITGASSQTGTFDVVVTVTDVSNPADTAQAALQITISALAFSGYDTATNVVNQPFSFQVSAYGGTTPYIYSALGLPTGLSIDPNSGLITGTPTQVGNAYVTLSVTDSADPADSIQEQFYLSINPFGIASPVSLTGTVGTPFSYQPQTIGGTAPLTYSSSTLPPGLTLNPSTGAITGTPTQSLSYGVNYTITDSSLPANTDNSIMVITIAAGSGPATVDVQPVNVILGGGSVTAGGSLLVNWTINNNGTGPAASSFSQVRITASGTSYGNSSNNVGTGQATGTISAGGSVAQSETVTVPSAPGTYYVWVIADSTGLLTQSNTSNDEAVSSSFTVTAAPTVDVQPVNVIRGGGSVTAGGSLLVNWTINNNGTGLAASSFSQVRITTSATSYGNSSNNVGPGQATGTIASGGSVAQSETVTVPSAPGTYYVWVIADSTGLLTQSNTSNDEAVSSSFTVTAAATTTTLGLLPSSAVYGQSVTFTATVATAPTSATVPTGTVQFSVNGTPVGGPVAVNGSGQSTFASASLATGSLSITAAYSPTGGNFTASNSAASSLVVNQAATTTALGFSSNPVVIGQVETLTATVTAVAPSTAAVTTGTVQFKVNGSAVGAPVSLNGSGQATFSSNSLPAGSLSINATYSPAGGGNFTASSSTSSLTVNLAAGATTTALGLSPSSAVYGQSVNFTATVATAPPSATVPTGTVQFSVNGTPVGTGVALNGSGQATLATATLGASGSPYSIAAAYSPNSSSFTASSSLASSLTVNQAATATALGLSPASSVYGQQVTFTATVAAVAPSTATVTTGTVQFSANGTPMGTAQPLNSSGQASFATASLPAGSLSITAAYAPATGGNFTVSSGASSLTVSQAATTTALGLSSNPISVGQQETFTATVTAVAPSTATVTTGTVQFKANGSAVGVPVSLNGSGQASFASNSLPTGSLSITAGYAPAAGGNFTASSSAASSLTVNLGIGPFVGFGKFGPIIGGLIARGGLNPKAVGSDTNLAAFVAANGASGTMVGYIASINAGFTANFTLTNGGFTTTTTTLTGGVGLGQTLTLTGSLSNGVLSGTIEELSLPFSVTLDPSSGASTAVAGLYEASSPTSGSVTYSIVGTQGEMFALAITPGLVSAGAGTVNSNDTFTVTTSQGTAISGSINAGTTAISGTVTPQGGGAISVSGESTADSPTVSPASQNAACGSTATLTVSTSAASPTYQWQLNGSSISGATTATLVLSNISTMQAGSYTAVVTSSGGSATSSAGTVTVSVGSYLYNMSARAYLGAGPYQNLVAGFYTSGSGSKNVVIRGIGPGLASVDPALAGLTLASPRLTLFNGSAATLATDAAWGGGQTLINAFANVYAFPLQANSNDTAVFMGVPAGSGIGYTAEVDGLNGGTGIALVEIYDYNSYAGTPASRLVNISARGYVGSGNNALVAGFWTIGGTSQTLLIRAVGPGLAASSPALSGLTLARPALTLYDAAGNIIATNTGWGTAPVPGSSPVAAGIQPATAAIMSGVYAAPLAAGSSDCAMIVTVPANAGYTVQVGGSGSAGIALVEVYNVP